MHNFSGEFAQELDTGKVIINYVLGKKNGVTKFLDRHGIVLSEINYKDDLIDGDVKQYYQSGNILSIITYRAGIQHGPFISYYENGMKQMESFYSNGKSEGEIVVFDVFGDIMSETQYHGGLKNGASILNYPKSQGGKVFETSRYEDGNLVGDKIQYYNTGEVMSITPYIKGKAQAYPRNFDKNGNEI
ncbi:MAG: toxin-antitoxin system YwqK family antitoxin [Holosporales bacterium]|nr:toxin-antitoxin system YwqK family antitoxin [Holosporales bacterium]